MARCLVAFSMRLIRLRWTVIIFFLIPISLLFIIYFILFFFFLFIEIRARGSHSEQKRKILCHTHMYIKKKPKTKNEKWYSRSIEWIPRAWQTHYVPSSMLKMITLYLLVSIERKHFWNIFAILSTPVIIIHFSLNISLSISYTYFSSRFLWSCEWYT